MKPRSIGRNLTWNVAGEGLPALAAVVAIPVLVHRLGAERFGILTLSWMLAGYFGLFDLGLGRALTQALVQQWNHGNRANAAALFWSTLGVMLAASVSAASTLALAGPWLVRSALRIPFALQSQTLTACYLIAIGLPMLISASALRAALTAADRFDLLNLIRTPIGIMSFVAPLAVLMFTHSLAWLIGALMLNRAVSWALYFGAALHAIPDLRVHFAIDLRAMPPLFGFGAWISVSALVAPMLVYMDRFLIGALLPVAALAAYSVPMEIVSKSFVFPAAVSGVMFPAFARCGLESREAATVLFVRAVKLIALVLIPVFAALIAFAPQIMATWIDPRFARQSAELLQILAIGGFITGLAWIPLALLHGVRRPDLPAKLHLVDFPVYALMLAVAIRRFGLAGAALIWTARMLLENLVLFAMAARYLEVTAQSAAKAAVGLAGAIMLLAAGALINPLLLKTIFMLAVLLLATAAALRMFPQRFAAASYRSMLPSPAASLYRKASD